MKKTPAFPVEAWEWVWAPHDAHTYELVLEQIAENDIVLEIGAGDLRLSRQIAERAKWIYALEINRPLLERSSNALPANMQTIVGDAREAPFPENITVAVLLMRHCTHFSLYFDKLRAVSCQRLITNARWGMNVETTNLIASRCSYQTLEIGWYACRCGNCGFKSGPPQVLTEQIADQVWELDSCPVCNNKSQQIKFNRKEVFTSTQGLPW